MFCNYTVIMVSPAKSEMTILHHCYNTI